MSQYWAFISYSHQDNVETRSDGSNGWFCWADWLYDRLRGYQVPEELVGQKGHQDDPIPERLAPIFKDLNELPASSDLDTAVRDALQRSRHLIVICSPRSAISAYVNEEIRYFKSLGRANRIVSLIVAGEPNAGESGHSQECFPETLRFAVDADGELDMARREQPLAADVRVPLSGVEIRDEDWSDYEKITSLEIMRVTAGVLGIGLSRLIDWDEELKKEEALKLFRSGQKRLEEAKKLNPDTNTPEVIRSLVDAEESMVSSLGLDPDSSECRESLGLARKTLFELALRNTDLNLATVYLEKIRNDPLLNMENVTGMWNELESEWEIRDPARNPSVRSALRWSLSSPAASMAFLALIVWWIPAEIIPFLLLANVLTVSLQALTIFWLLRMMQGWEEALHRLSLTLYGLFAVSLPSNPVGLVMMLIVVGKVFRLKNFRFVWKQ